MVTFVPLSTKITVVGPPHLIEAFEEDMVLNKETRGCQQECKFSVKICDGPKHVYDQIYFKQKNLVMQRKLSTVSKERDEHHASDRWLKERW